MIALLLLIACKGGAADDSASSEPAFHCGVIAADERWLKRNNPHTVTCDLEVEGGVLTVEEGVEVLVYPGVSISVAKAGTMSGFVVAGSAAEPVSFTLGAEDGDEAPEPWDGITLYSATTAPSLAFATIDQGGDAGAALRVQGTELAVQSLSITGAPEDGLVLEENGRLTLDSSGLVISGSGGVPVIVDATNAHTLPAAGSDYTGNGFDAISVQDGDIIDEVSWEDLGVPYVLYRDVGIEGTTEAPAGLAIGGGATLLFDEGSSLVSSAGGGSTTLVIGEPGGDPVTLAALDGDENGYWTGVYAYPGTDRVELYNATLSLGGGDQRTEAALWIEGDIEALLQDVHISGSANDGIVLEGGARLDPDSHDINVSNCDNYPITIRADQAHTLLPGTFTDNGVDGARVLEATLSESVYWEDLGAPYVIADIVRVEGRADQPAVLTLGPGTNLLVDVGAGFTLAERGGAAGLIAAGEPTAQVQLRALRADQDGFWGSIRAYRGVAPGDFALYNTIIDGGGGDLDAMVLVNDAAVYVENVTLSNSRGLGFELGADAWFLDGSAGLELDSNTDQGKIGAGALHTLPQNLRFSGQTSNNSDSHGFQVLFVTNETDITQSATWRALDDGAVYWVEDRLVVDGTAEAPIVITIEEGSTWWMGDGTGLYISAVSGGAAGLVVGGSREPTVFTAAEASSPGRWYGLRILDHCLDGQVSLENTTISYAGKSGDRFSPAGLLLEGCTATLEDVTISHSDKDGLIVSGDATISNSSFEDNYLCGISASTFETVYPTMTNIHYSGNFYGDLCN